MDSLTLLFSQGTTVAKQLIGQHWQIYSGVHHCASCLYEADGFVCPRKHKRLGGNANRKILKFAEKFVAYRYFFMSGPNTLPYLIPSFPVVRVLSTVYQENSMDGWMDV